jgi:transposase, IS30 family
MPEGYHHMTLDIRSQIYALKATGTSLHKIASIVGHHVSTISREINRNTGGRGYRYKQANNMAIERRSSASCTPKRLTEECITIIKKRLKQKWSPEQISGRSKLEGIDMVSYEAIYQYVWLDKRCGGNLYKHLRHHNKKYNKRSSGKAGRGCIPNRIDIAERPAIVEQKRRVGDWEGDTIIGAKHKGAIVSYVDRCSKFTVLKKVKNKTAELVSQATLEKLGQGLPVLTITYDNGKEFSEHCKIASQLNAKCYFARPYHSWERGLNEHTNGLVRQYLPKSTDFTKVSDKTVQCIADKLNNRPRKILNYKTPIEVLMMHQSKRTAALSIRDG